MTSGVLAIDIAYAFGMLVVVPMGVWLLGGRSGGAAGAFLLGATGARGLFVKGDPGDPGVIMGVALVGAWALFVAMVAASQVIGFIKQRREPDLLVRAVRVIAAVFLVVSAASAMAFRAGLQPFGFPPLIVFLTAVHYLFTGFGAVLFCSKVVAWDAVPRRTLALGAAFAVVAGTPVIAAGITMRQITGASWWSVGETLGAILIAAGLTVVAWQAFVAVGRSAEVVGAARWLLRVPAGVVVFSMGLAVVYALHRWLGTPALTEKQMAESHGVLNALGFVGCGLAGWVAYEHAAVHPNER